MTNAGIRTIRILSVSLAVALLLTAVIGCGSQTQQPTETPVPDNSESSSVTTPDFSSAARAGEEVFNANCSLCHGVNAVGTSTGPPLVDRIYEPGHHADFSIRSAVRNGVPQHHWWFGDMPPVAGVSDQEVEQLICYVRELQRANDIFDDTTYSIMC